MNWLALDIGGANLKVADGLGYAESFPLPLWRDSGRLAQEIRTVIAHAPASDHLAVTMTGELADCFETKAAGVSFILAAVTDAADGRHTRVYLSDGRLVTPTVAATLPSSVAAANWHAIASFAARFTEQAPALVIDVGSTTCDVIPLIKGKPATDSQSDTQRLLRGELIYIGVERTPIATIVDEVPYREGSCPIARELFATTRDVYTLLGRFPDAALVQDTADGKPSTRAAAKVRLGRMICADESEFNHRDAAIMAEAVAESFADELATRIQQVQSNQSHQPTVCVLSGHGEFVAQTALDRLGFTGRRVSVKKEIGELASRCAPAHALAVLAREETGK